MSLLLGDVRIKLFVIECFIGEMGDESFIDDWHIYT